MSKLITQIKRVALALCFATPLVSRADAEPITAVNPVTGETETYTYKFVGTDTWDGTNYWQNSSGANPSAVPAKSGDNTWDPILFDGNTININAGMSVEGWNLCLGLYNGANVRLDNFVKWQGDTDMWVTVDGTSKFTVGAFGKGNIANGKAIKCSTTRANGIEWLVNLESNGNANNTFEYYLAGEGSVSYQGVTAANHKIKQADVALSGNEKSVQSKTLVSFTSTDKTFTADAAIKVKNGDNVLKTVYLTNVTADATTLTTDDDVGACELVQTSTGIDLYWVDGDPANLPAPTVYKPSININFTNGAGNGLTTGADVGLDGYAVPGTSWNNYVVANSTFSTVNAVDSTGAASAMSGVSVTISDVSSSWSCSGLTASSDFRQSYIDESAAKSTPTVTVTGIPYYKYRVLVYHSTDTANVPFGYDTINGTNYTYVEDALSEGTTAWGASGPANSANAIAEGGNVLVTEALSGSTLTVVGHRAGGDSSARGCIAAIQIIEVKPDVGENDLEIAVDGDTNYTVSEAQNLSGTVYLTGSGTLTLDGSAKISASTIDVGLNVTLNINADRLDATTFTGAGTVVYDGSQPDATKGFDNSAWTGTVWVKNIGSAPAGETSTTAVALGSVTDKAAENTINSWGNANSYVKFTNVRGHVAAANCPWTLILEDGSDTYAWYNNNGWTGYNITIAALEGDGTFYDQGNNGCRQILTFTEASNFAGSFNIAGKRIGLGGNNTAENNQAYRGTIEVASGKTVTVAADKTWTTGMGFRVYGTINANGTLAADSSATACAVGTGTVVFGGVPSPTGDKWWKNAAWDGTVEIKGATALNGDYAFNDYGNSDSTLKLTNCSGWLKPNYTCVPALEIGGTFTWNDGSSGLNNTFKVATLKGSGTISIPNQGAATAVWQITDDWSGFTGPVIGNNGAAKRVLVFGSTLPATATAGVIYVSEGATLDLDNSSGAWWGVGMGFVVDGTVKASARNKWGGGTYMTLGDTGVLELVSTANTDDQNTEMGNITGTGTLKFSSSAGWRAFPKVDANMPATTLTIQTELADSLIVPTKNDGETVIGNLAGSKNVRSDWSDNGENGRILTVTQSKDTEWQGKFVSNRITQFNVVAPTEGTPGTLTLSGAQQATIPMQVDGSVNLTGTWKGATTVAGTFGGTGTLTGDLTFGDDAALKLFSTDEDGLTVTGTVTYPTDGQVAVRIPSTFEGEAILMTADNLDAEKFYLAAGAPSNAKLEVVDSNKLKVSAPETIAVLMNTQAAAMENCETMSQAITALSEKSGNWTLYVQKGENAVDALTVQSGLTLTVVENGGTIAVTTTTVANGGALTVRGGTFTTINVAGTLAVNSGTPSVVLTDAAASCTVAAALVESVTVSSGVEGKVVSKSEDTNPVYTLVDAPSDTYEITGETTLGEGGTLDIGSATKIKIGTYDVTDGFSIDGTTATLLAPEVEEEATKKAIDVGATTVTLNVELVPGLYYGVASGTGLTLTRPETLTQYTGENDAAILSVNKPSTEKGFFKVFVDIKE